MRVSVCSTNAIPSLSTSSSVGARSPRICSGVNTQCVAFCSSPNTATAWAITGTRLITLGDVTPPFYSSKKQRQLLVELPRPHLLDLPRLFRPPPPIQNPHDLPACLVDRRTIVVFLRQRPPLLHDFEALRQPELLARDSPCLPRQPAQLA